MILYWFAMQKWARPLEHPVTISGNRRMWNIPNYFLANLAIADLGKKKSLKGELSEYLLLYISILTSIIRISSPELWPILRAHSVYLYTFCALWICAHKMRTNSWGSKSKSLQILSMDVEGSHILSGKYFWTLSLFCKILQICKNLQIEWQSKF